MVDKIKSEPVAFFGLLTALVTALIALALGFEWVNWTEVQVGLVLGVWAAIVAVFTFFVRSRVSPV